MSDSTEVRWYVRIRGQTTGPISRPELDNLIRAGVLRHDAEISSDGTHWEPAEPARSPIIRVRSTSRPCALWFHGLLLGVGFLAGLIAMLIALVVIGMIMEATSPPALTPIAISGEATWAYWQQSAEIVASASSRQGLDLAGCEQVATQFQALPVDAVDPDAVASITSVVSTIRQVVDTSQRQAVPLEPPIQGSATSAAVDRKNADLWAPVESNVGVVKAQLESTRLTLEQRYGRQFPTIVF